MKKTINEEENFTEVSAPEHKLTELNTSEIYEHPKNPRKNKENLLMKKGLYITQSATRYTSRG